MGSKQASAVDENRERILFSTRIDRKLIKKIKFISVEEEKEIYTLVEEALKQFIKGKGKQ
jgi:hypothetical protein